MATSHLVRLQSDSGENNAQYDKEANPDKHNVVQNT